MKKRTRPTFLRHLEDRYDHDGGRLVPTRNEFKPAAAIRVKVKRTASAAGKGAIDMTVQQFVGLAIFFVLIACVATSATTFAVVRIAGSGPQGEQGIAGVQGPAGERGAVGLQGLPGNEASQEMIKRLAALFAVQQTSGLNGGVRIDFNDSRVSGCVSYVMTGKPDVGACAGFSSGGQ